MWTKLDVTFVAFPTTTGEPLADGTRFLDNQSIDGPIPVMVDGTLAVLRRNMKRRSIVVGVGREDVWEYPEDAIRELIANALMHRDYHPLARGTQVRVELYPDRLEILSPGGLHGPVSRDDLLAEPVTSSRNALLAKLLEVGGRWEAPSPLCRVRSPQRPERCDGERVIAGHRGKVPGHRAFGLPAVAP